MKENSTIYYKSCQSCGRPQTYCKGECCGKPQGCQCKEYGPKACGCIRQKAPECPYEAVIPSVTVESVSNLKDLADCFVHVSDINTTFYIDDKHRIMTTWAGLVSVEDYDFEANPLNLRGQIAYDAKNNVAAIYDKQGANYIFQISDIENDYMLLENKPAINGVTLEGNKSLKELDIPAIEEVALVFDTVADMRASTDLVDGSYARTLGYYAINDGGGATYYITDGANPDSFLNPQIGDLVAHLVIKDNTIHSKQVGLKGDNSTNETSAMASLLGYAKDGYNITVDSGIYLINDKIVVKGTWYTASGNAGTPKIEFNNASLHYTGTVDGYSIVFHSFFKWCIKGLSFTRDSVLNRVGMIGCWFVDCNNWYTKSLELTNDSTIIAGASYATQSIEYLSFKDCMFDGSLYITTLQTTSFINCVNFYNSSINGSNSQSYCVELAGLRAKQNINFYNCDLSYATDSVFNVVDDTNGKGSVNLIGCYLDSSIPVFKGDNKKGLEFNALLSTLSANSDNELFNIKFTDYMKNTIYGGYNGHNYNLAIGNVNYAKNGNMESTATGGSNSSIMGNSYGNWAKTGTTSDLNIYGHARQVSIQTVSPVNPVFNVEAINAPRTGQYTAYMRFKLVNGSCDSVSIQFNGTYSSIDGDRFSVGDEIVLTNSKDTVVTAGASLSYKFYAIGASDDFSIEVYEVGVTDGKVYIPNLPLHASAKFPA